MRYRLVPGLAAEGGRQISVAGPIRSSDVGKRKTPPPSLSSIAVEGDIGDMKQYDRGHLVALELDGFDDSRVIAPMNYRFNRSGKWRTMEITIGKLIDDEDATDVGGNSVEANPRTRSAVSLSLTAKNKLNLAWQIEVQLLYDDVRGDPRVPIWFYVRVFKNKSLITHFSLANACDKPATMPDAKKVAEFESAKVIFAALKKGDLQAIKVGSYYGRKDPLYATLKDADLDTLEPSDLPEEATEKDLEISLKLSTYINAYLTGNALPDRPPNQLLQFMWDANQAAKMQGLDKAVFKTMKLTEQKESTPYDWFQREYMRAFNRWKNYPTTRGKLISDAAKDGVYEGEKADVWTELSECGGREAPEVDHIDPSYQSGENSYINGRLVSFQHNHLYREKKPWVQNRFPTRYIRCSSAGNWHS